MPLGTSILLIAVGAILRFAVHVHTSGFNLHTVGIILIVAGVIGLLLSLLWMSVWSRRGDRRAYIDRRRRDIP